VLAPVALGRSIVASLAASVAQWWPLIRMLMVWAQITGAVPLT